MKTMWTIHKWVDGDGEVERLLRLGYSQTSILKLYPKRFKETQIVNENLLLNEGIQYLLDIIIGVEGSARTGKGAPPTTEDDGDGDEDIAEGIPPVDAGTVANAEGVGASGADQSRVVISGGVAGVGGVVVRAVVSRHHPQSRHHPSHWSSPRSRYP